jgi:hypothetical protein
VDSRRIALCIGVGSQPSISAVYGARCIFDEIVLRVSTPDRYKLIPVYIETIIERIRFEFLEVFGSLVEYRTLKRKEQ